MSKKEYYVEMFNAGSLIKSQPALSIGDAKIKLRAMISYMRPGDMLALVCVETDKNDFNRK